MMSVMALLSLVLTSALCVASADDALASLSPTEVQQLLRNWNLYETFGYQFEQQKYVRLGIYAIHYLSKSIYKKKSLFSYSWSVWICWQCSQEFPLGITHSAHPGWLRDGPYDERCHGRRVCPCPPGLLPFRVFVGNKDNKYKVEQSYWNWRPHIRRFTAQNYGHVLRTCDNASARTASCCKKTPPLNLLKKKTNWRQRTKHI